jgi:magnesium chelatase family protein
MRLGPGTTGQPPPRTEPQWVVCDHFVLIAAMNPCPCGYYGDPERECTCSQQMITRYQKRISIPILIGPVSTSTSKCRAWTCTACLDKLASDRLGEPSEAVHACRGDTHGSRRRASATRSF